MLDRWVPGGLTKHVSELSTQLADLGVVCTVAAWLPPEVEPPQGIDFVPLPLYSENERKSPVGFVKAVRKVRTCLIEKKIQILHMHNRYVTLLAAAASKGLGIKRIYTVHSAFEDMRYLCFYPETVICLNEAGRVSFLANWFLPDGLNTFVIPNGIDLSHMKDIQENATPLTFGFVGRLDRMKGVHLILQAVGETNAAVRVLIAGTGPQENELRALSKSLGVTDRVTFLGHLDDPGPIYSKSLALIVPSTEVEGFGYVILESFARKRPVIVSDIEAFDATVSDGVTGWRFECGNPESLAKVLDRALGEPNLLKEMGNNGHKLLLERFTLDKMAASTLAVYKASLNGHNELVY